MHNTSQEADWQRRDQPISHPKEARVVIITDCISPERRYSAPLKREKGMIKGLLVDIDGTLVRSNEAHARSWVEASEKIGRQVEYERALKLMGMGGDKLIPTLFPDLIKDEGLGKEVSDYRKDLFLREYAPQLEPTPGARELIGALKAQGVRHIVASSSSKEELEVLLKIADVADLLTEHTSSNDAEESKPAPDIVSVDLQKINLPAGEVLMLGDSPFDIEAAGKIAVRVVAVRCGQFTDEELAGALAVYDHPQDILEHLGESPLAP